MSSSQEKDYVDIKDLLRVLYKGKAIILACVVVFSVGGILYSLWLPNVYQSDILLAPTAAESSNMSGLSSQFGGLANLAGLSLPSSSGDKTVMGLEVLRSRVFLKYFIQKHEIDAMFYAAIGIDKATGNVLFDKSLYDIESGKWIDSKRPTERKIYEKFIKNLVIVKDTKTGFVTIAFQHVSPQFAKFVVTELVNDINSTVKKRDVLQAERSIEYLKNQLQENTLSELETGLYELIQSQTQTIMLANARPEYLFQVIDPAVTPDKKVKPLRAVICILAALLGGLLSSLLLITRSFVIKR